MVFSSAVFLFAFLPLTIFGYFLLPRKWRNAYLMLASLVFYAWGEPKFVLVMIASILMNYHSQSPETAHSVPAAFEVRAAVRL